MSEPDMLGATPVDEWPREIDEPVEVFVEHWNLRYKKGADRDRWRGWFRASWTDFNGGGWIWHGMFGRVTHVRPINDTAPTRTDPPREDAT